MNPTEGLPYAHGIPISRGSIKTVPEDFIVEEILSFEPSGSGEHAMVHVEKWGENTDFIARELARFTGTKARDIGFAGLKDRHGRTTQWFSVQLPGQEDPDWTQFFGDHFKVIAHTRNDRKLRRGALNGNRFTLRIRDLDKEPRMLAERITAIQKCGVPNYFGPQRFGREGDNVDRALDLMRNPEQRINPHLRGIFLSSARSHLFNQILAKRVLLGSWNNAVCGDIYMFPDSKSHFEADAESQDIKERICDLRIHPSGPLVGKTPSVATLEAAKIEQEVFQDHQELMQGLISQDLESMRRPLRLVPLDLSWSELEPGVLELAFALPAGSYATTVLRELVKFDATQTPEV